MIPVIVGALNTIPDVEFYLEMGVIEVSVAVFRKVRSITWDGHHISGSVSRGCCWGLERGTDTVARLLIETRTMF